MQPVDSVAFHARFDPQRLAVIEIFSGRRWTYAALDEAIARCAGALAEEWHVNNGDRVAALAANRAELMMLHFACARIGAIYVPINWRLSPRELTAIVEDVDAKLLVGDDQLDKAGLHGVDIDAFAARCAQAAPLATNPLDPDRVSLILYTSGTSGQPKGAMITERNLNELGLNSSLFQRVDRDSRYLIDSPMFHIIGIGSSIRPPLFWGGSIVISDGFDAERTLARIGDPELGITHYFCVPQMSSILRRQPGFDPAPFRRLTALFSGGAPHPESELNAWLDDGVPVISAYGLSEAGSVLMMPIDIEEIRAHPRAVGIATPRIDVRLVDGDGRDCPAGTPGEVLLKGDNVFTGYWRRPQQTSEAFTVDGWLRTGDVAVLRDGYYEIVDRKKDMFISGGENVYPAEIENVMSLFPGVQAVAVVGVPDERWGEVGHMVVVGDAIKKEDVLLFLAERIARYKVPKHISFMQELPRTGSGKVRKDVLRASLLQQVADSPTGKSPA